MAEEKDALEGALSVAGGKEQETFEALKAFSESAERLRGLISLPSDWYESFRPPLSVSLHNDASNAYQDAKALKAALEVYQILEPTQRALSPIFQWTASQTHSCSNQLRILRLRTGFRSFPDEVLSLVLEFAAYHVAPKGCRDDDRVEAIVSTMKASNTLSRVCTRFRFLIKSSPCLWDRIHPKMNPNAITLSLTRCGRGAEVHLSNHLSSPVHRRGRLEDFISTVVQNSRYWRRLVVDCDHMDYYRSSIDAPKWLEQIPASWTKSTHGLDVPSLTSIHIMYPEAAILSSNMFDDSRIHFYQLWSTPNLRSMATHNFIPLPFQGSRRLQSLSLDISFDWYGPQYSKLDIRALASFLLSCPVLEELALRLRGCKAIVASSSDDVALLKSVSVLKLGLKGCEAAVVKSLSRALCFPDISDMDVDVCGPAPVGNGNGTVAGLLGYVRSVIEAVFPGVGMYPHVTRFRLSAEEDSNGEDLPISVPFSSLSSALEHLELELYRVTPALIPQSVSLPNLRSVTFSECRALDASWIKDLLRCRFQFQETASQPQRNSSLSTSSLLLVVDEGPGGMPDLVDQEPPPPRRFMGEDYEAMPALIDVYSRPKNRNPKLKRRKRSSVNRMLQTILKGQAGLTFTRFEPSRYRTEYLLRASHDSRGEA